MILISSVSVSSLLSLTTTTVSFGAYSEPSWEASDDSEDIDIESSTESGCVG